VPSSIDIFISYAADDAEHARKLEEHLALLKRDGDIRAWHQGLVGAGGDPRRETEEWLQAARIVVLLVSSTYLASDYLYSHELLPAIQRGNSGAALIIPVVVGAHDTGKAPYAHLPLLPRNQVPVAAWQRRDDAWAEVAKEIRQALKTLGDGRKASPIAPKSAPPKPIHEDPESRQLTARLDAARAARAELAKVKASTADVDQDILNLRRQLREGGRLRSGDTLRDGRYRLIQPLGRGGFATVWSAFDRVRGERVAVKVLHAELAGDPRRCERFFRGARVMASLGHEAVVRVLDPGGDDGGHLFFVMELMPGGDLQHAIVNGKVPRERVVPLLLSVGDALAEAHAKGIVHRDVKPANILLDEQGMPRLTDFDLVAAGHTTGGTRTGAVMGSWLYMAPEQRRDAKQADVRADVYALGMTALFCLHGGELPDIREARPEEVIEGLSSSRAVKRVLLRAIKVSPNKRFTDAQMFCKALRTATPRAPRGAQASTPQAPPPSAHVARATSAPDAEWYIAVKGVPTGPINISGIRERAAAKEVDGESFVWREGLTDWREIRTFPELFQVVMAAQTSLRNDGL
jgi:hypothetical protein